MNYSKYKDALEHFNTLVIKLDNGCWILSTATANGYSQFGHLGVKYRAHIFSYKNFVGPIHGTNEIHHKCEFKPCVNPDHLEQLTNQEHLMKHPNNILCQNALKTHCPQGHEYNDENTFRDKKGRQCKACRKVQEAKRHLKRYPLKRLLDAIAKCQKA